MKPTPRHTMADIARGAGVTVATVSLALKNDRRLPEPTRRRIQALARRLGYRPNPLVSALMAQLHGRRLAAESPVLAYLNLTKVCPHGRNFLTMQRYWDGAAVRAGELGYRLEEFWLREPGMTPERLANVFTARGIAGIIIAPPDPETKECGMAWEHFAVASIDHVLDHPHVHWASANHYAGMWLALENLDRLGYRRIGLVMSRDADIRVNHAWVSAFGGCQLWRPRRQRVPPYLTACVSQWEPRRFAEWLRRCQPEAIVCSESGIPELLAKGGLRIPDDIGLAHLAVDCAEIPCAGIDQNSERVGAAAVDIVVGQLHLNERGIPPVARNVMIEGRWVDGPTVRRAAGSDSAFSSAAQDDSPFC